MRLGHIRFFMKRKISADRHQQYPKLHAVFLARQTTKKQLQKVIKFLKDRLPTLKSFYQMPWYLTIGYKNSGKTHLISSSGLTFLEKDTFVQLTPENMETQSQINYWISPGSVLIDVPGYYLDQETLTISPARAAWLTLLQQLNRYRPHHTLNGIILVIDANQFDHYFLTHRLKNSIEEIVYYSKHRHKLKQRLPIYIVISKIDQLQGFTDYYDDLSETEQAQCCGLTLPLSLSESTNWGSIFSEAFDRFLSHLHERALWRIHQERDLKKRQSILNFPYQVDLCLKDKLKQVVYLLNNLHSMVLLRGVYFTSSSQNSNYADNALQQKIARHFGVMPLRASQKQKKTFFITSLFTQVIFSESHLTADWLKKNHATRYSNLLRWGLLSLAGICLITIITTLSHFYQKQTVYLSKASTALSEYKILSVTYDKQNPSMAQLLPALNALKLATENATKASLPWFSRFQLHQKIDLPILTQQIYNNELQNHFIPAIKSSIEHQLNNSSVTDSSELYGLLKTYLLLSKPLSENKTFLQYWFFQKWQNPLVKNPDFRKHLELAFQPSVSSVTTDVALIQKTRAMLNALPYGLLTHAIIANEFISPKPLILNITNAQYSLILPNRLPVNSISNNSQSVINQALSMAINGNAVLGNKIATSLSVAEIKILKNDLLNSYQQDDEQMWKAFLAQIKLRSFSSLNTLNLALQELISRQSPLIQILHFIQNNDPYYRTPSFTLKPILSNLSHLEMLVHKILRSRYMGETTLLYAQAIMRPNDPIARIFSSLEKQAENSPEPFKPLLFGILHQTQSLLFKQALHEILQQWRVQIFPICHRTLDNHYPFGSSKPVFQETKLQDFARFFEKGGIFEQFFTVYLEPFVDTTQPRWIWKKINGIVFSNSDLFLQQFERAKIINTLFFNQKNQLFMPFKITHNNVIKYCYHWPVDTAHIQLVENDFSLINYGDWSIFKLVDQANQFKLDNTNTDPKRQQQYQIIFNYNHSMISYFLSVNLINPFLARDIIRDFQCPYDL